MQDLGLLKPRGRQCTDSTHILAAVRTMNRLERVGETLRAALNGLAVIAPEWLTAELNRSGSSDMAGWIIASTIPPN